MKTRTFLVFFVLALPAFAKTHEDKFSLPCKSVWAAVKDVLMNSGKYRIVSVSNEDMLASYSIGGWVAGSRTNSVVLKDAENNSCSMQIQTRFTGAAHNDAGDFKKRVEESLAHQGAH